MSVKFRLAFDVEAETLFKLMSKLLPIDNLNVEELRPNVTAKLTHEPKLMAPKAKRRGGSAGLGSRGGADITKGVARIIMGLLSDGKPHSQSELKPLVKKEGYSPSGLASRLNKLMAHGLIHQPDYGLWAIGEKPKKTSAA